MEIKEEFSENCLCKWSILEEDLFFPNPKCPIHGEKTKDILEKIKEKEDENFYSPKNIRKYQLWFKFFASLILIFLIIYLVVNIESVKILLNNPCNVCMSKTGATCFYPIKYSG